MLTLIKNTKDWDKHYLLMNERVKAIDNAPPHSPSNPTSFPCLVYSYLIPRGARFEIRHIITYRDDAERLLAIK